MSESPQVEESIGTHKGTGKAFKRRGLVAGAAALVAGVVATRASQSVSAGSDGDVILGATNSTTGVTRITNTTGGEGSIALFLTADSGSNGNGLTALASGIAIAGSSSGANGVAGATSSETEAGVEGIAQNNAGGVGVLGRSFSNVGIGVHGTTTGGTGVMGQTTTGAFGVFGSSGAANGVGVGGSAGGGTGVAGTATDGTGVAGQAVSGVGISGSSQRNHGVVGTTSQANFGGVFGLATVANTVGIYGSTRNGGTSVAGAIAGFMDGNLVVAHGARAGAVPLADGTNRLVYGMESPESWIEDFGEAKTVHGSAEVKLDAVFAQIVHTDTYQVFLTTYGDDGNGLNVAERRADGFVVKERNKGNGGGTFGYRIVAKRKDIVAGRLATFDLPSSAPQVPKAPQIPQPPKLPAVPTAPPKR
jgi:hypothetical protein